MVVKTGEWQSQREVRLLLQERREPGWVAELLHAGPHQGEGDAPTQHVKPPRAPTLAARARQPQIRREADAQRDIVQHVEQVVVSQRDAPQASDAERCDLVETARE
jgi:hypothetical protein